MDTTVLNIRNVPRELAKRLRVECAELDTTITEYVIQAIKEKLKGGGAPDPSGEVRVQSVRKSKDAVVTGETHPVEQHAPKYVTRGGKIVGRVGFCAHMTAIGMYCAGCKGLAKEVKGD